MEPLGRQRTVPKRMMALGGTGSPSAWVSGPPAQARQFTVACNPHPRRNATASLDALIIDCSLVFGGLNPTLLPLRFRRLQQHFDHAGVYAFHTSRRVRPPSRTRRWRCGIYPADASIPDRAAFANPPGALGLQEPVRACASPAFAHPLLGGPNPRTDCHGVGNPV